jgi:hypothetical protein
MVRLAPARIGALAVTSLLLLGSLASCTSTARINDVYMALDAEGDRRRSVFFTDSKEIHCVVEMGIGREGTTIESIVRQLQAYDFEADRFFETDRVAANTEAAPQAGTGLQKLDITLKPSGPNGEDATGEPFPPGRFQCEAYLDGKLEQVAIFNIDFPPCPQASIRPGSLCYGFYKKDLECPKYGVTSRDPLACGCRIGTGWECQKG